MAPRDLVDLVDFRYLEDALTRVEALDLLERGAEGRAGRIAALERDGYPAYTTTPGWLGYSDERLAELCAEAVADGFGQVKLKAGARLEDDIRRMGIARAAVGEDIAIALDANQVWDVPTAISWIQAIAVGTSHTWLASSAMAMSSPTAALAMPIRRMSSSSRAPALSLTWPNPSATASAHSSASRSSE